MPIRPPTEQQPKSGSFVCAKTPNTPPNNPVLAQMVPPSLRQDPIETSTTPTQPDKLSTSTEPKSKQPSPAEEDDDAFDIWAALRMPLHEDIPPAKCPSPTARSIVNPVITDQHTKNTETPKSSPGARIAPQKQQEGDSDAKHSTQSQRSGGWEAGTIRRSSTGSAPSLRKELLLSKRRTTSGGDAPAVELDMQHDEASILVYKQQVQERLHNDEEEIKKIIQSKDKLQQLLQDAVAGKKSVHNEIDPSQLQVLEEIAKGAAARVFKLFFSPFFPLILYSRARYSPPGVPPQIVAVKHYSRDYLNFDLNEFRKEIALMR